AGDLGSSFITFLFCRSGRWRRRCCARGCGRCAADRSDILERMRVVERHHVRNETFRVVGGNDLPTFLWRIRTGKLQSVCGTLLMHAALFIEEPVGRHVRINVDAARRIKMHMVPSRGVHRWLANGLNWPRRANTFLGSGGGGGGGG